MSNNIKSIIISCGAMVLIISAAPLLHAGGGPYEESVQASARNTTSSGTNVAGKSDGFVDYLNDDSSSKDNNTLELIRIDDNSNVELSGEDDPELALRAVY